MRFQLTMIARHFEEGLRALRVDPANVEAAESSYIVGSRQLGRVPWERAWAVRLKELFQLEQKLRAELDGPDTAAESGEFRFAADEVDQTPAP